MHGFSDRHEERKNNSKPNRWKFATLSLVCILFILIFMPMGKADVSIANQFIEIILQNGQAQDPFTIKNASGSTLAKIDAGGNAFAKSINATNVTAKNIGGVIYADQYATLQDAIDASDGLTLYINKNVTTSGIDINASIHIIGNRNNKITLADNSNDTVFDIYASNVSIENLFIDGNKANNNPSGEIYGIRLKGNDISIRDVTIIDTDYDAIIFADGYRNSIDNVYIRGSGHNGVTFWSTDRTLKRGHFGSNIRVYDSVLEGIGFGDVSGVTISNIYTQNNSRGIACDDARNNVVTNHNSYLDSYGAYIGCYGLLYNSFNIENSIDRGIYVFSGGGADVLSINPKALISAGSIINSGSHGIDITNGSVIEVSNTYIKNSTTHGISLTGLGNKENVFIHNNIIETASNGIRIGNNADIINKVILKDNQIINTTNQGIYVGDAITINYFEMKNNIIQNTTTDYFYGWATYGTLIIADNSGISPFNHGNLATAPTPFGEGDEYYNTVDHRKYYYNGTAWQQ